MQDTPLRLLLRVSVKLFVLLGLGIIVYTLLSSIKSDDPELSLITEPLQFSLESMVEDRPYRLAWSRGNLILIKRSEKVLESLEHGSENLLDPLSAATHQPGKLHPLLRSVRPALFVAFDRGTDLGCPLNWVTAANREAPVQPWPGGFRDSCRGSWYDAAGRVLKGQQAGRNLDIPPYRFQGEDLLEVGLTGIIPSSRIEDQP